MANLTTAEYRALKEHKIGDTPTPDAVRAAVKIHIREAGRRALGQMREDDRLRQRCRTAIARIRRAQEFVPGTIGRGTTGWRGD